MVIIILGYVSFLEDAEWRAGPIQIMYKNLVQLKIVGRGCVVGRLVSKQLLWKSCDD